MIVAIAVLLCAVPAGVRSAPPDGPPTVIEATPDHGDTDVDPGLTEIRVTFDRDMAVGSHSWVGGDPMFPKLQGKPTWDGKRTAVLPVELQPNHTYWLSINNQQHNSFRSVDGVPAEPYPISFTTAARRGGSRKWPLSAKKNRAAMEGLRRVIDENYSYRDRLGLDWDKLFKQYSRRLLEAKKPQDFARAAGELLAEAEDLHLWLKVGPATFASHQRAVPVNMNFKTLQRIVPEWKQHARSVFSGKFDDGIGYILIGTWSSKQDGLLAAALTALEELADAPGLVIDMRANSGGDETLAQQFAGRFVTSSKVYAKHVNRDPSAPEGFSAPFERVLKPNRKGKRYLGKVAVLTGPQNMSSCEAFLLMMKQVRGARLIGEASYGSSGNPKPFDLGNGVTVFIPSWRAMRPDGSCFEGEGIAPDIRVKAEPDDFRNDDPVLKAALDYLRSS
jgi:hypothetical protein